MRILDDLATERELEGHLGLKIDTEGFEMEALRGATRIVAETLFVLVDASLPERFKGSCQFDELVSFLSENEFCLGDVLHIARRRNTGEALFVDALFVSRSHRCVDGG